MGRDIGRKTWKTVVAVGPGWALSLLIVGLQLKEAPCFVYIVAAAIALLVQVVLVLLPIQDARKCCTTTLLHALHVRLTDGGKGPFGLESDALRKDDDPRLTVFVSCRFRERLRQLARYYRGITKVSSTTLRHGVGPGGVAFNVAETIIIPDVTQNDSDAKGSWRATMKYWGMTENEIEKLHVKDRMGYACVAACEGVGKAVAVVCLDTGTKNSIKPQHVDLIKKFTPALVGAVLPKGRGGPDDD